MQCNLCPICIIAMMEYPETVTSKPSMLVPLDFNPVLSLHPVCCHFPISNALTRNTLWISLLTKKISSLPLSLLTLDSIGSLGVCLSNQGLWHAKKYSIVWYCHNNHIFKTIKEILQIVFSYLTDDRPAFQHQMCIQQKDPSLVESSKHQYSDLPLSLLALD